jgi:hypothetical protein
VLLVGIDTVLTARHMLAFKSMTLWNAAGGRFSDVLVEATFPARSSAETAK